MYGVLLLVRVKKTNCLNMIQFDELVFYLLYIEIRNKEIQSKQTNKQKKITII